MQSPDEALAVAMHENAMLWEEVEYYRRILFVDLNPQSASILNALRKAVDIVDDNVRLREEAELAKATILELEKQVEILKSQLDSLPMPVFASTASGVTEVNPWLLLHGVLFIINFSIVMPVASYLILRNRDKYDQVHKMLGVLTLILLVFGWAALGWSSKDTSTYKPLDTSEVALSHNATGIAARYISVGVIVTGVVVGVLRMSRKIRLMVRIAHGVSGLVLSFYGPVVVWNGWVRLAPSSTLSASPIVWMLVPIVLLIGLTSEQVWKRLKTKEPFPPGGDSTVKSAYTISDVTEMTRTKLVLIFEDEVLVIPPEWNHPGGNDFLYQYNGKDITFILEGSEAFRDMGRNRIVPHSAYAFTEMMKFTVGKLRLSKSPTHRPLLSRQTSRRGGSLSRQGVHSALTSAECTMTNTDKMRARIVSCEQINKANDLPVCLYVLHVEDPQYIGAIGVGYKVRISLHSDIRSLERSYTVADVDCIDQTISFCIKLYPNGQLTAKLKEKKAHDRIYLSYPNPCPLVPAVPTIPSLLVLIAAGTGMAPMISFYDKCSTLHVGGLLLWWVRNEDDLFFIEELKKLVTAELKLKVILFFTQPSSEAIQDCNGIQVKTGRISGDVMLEMIGMTYSPSPPLSDIAFVMSGPRGFISSAIESCQDMGVNNNRILSLD